MKKLMTLVVAGMVAACAGTQENPEGLTAQAAFDRAEASAAAWAADPDLRYVWGSNINKHGVPSQTGAWHFVYEDDNHMENLVIQVGHGGVSTTERRESMPQGWVMDGEIENDDWMDSPDVLESLIADRFAPVLSTEQVTMFLFPVNPAQWVVRVMEGTDRFEYRVNAYTGETAAL